MNFRIIMIKYFICLILLTSNFTKLKCQNKVDTLKIIDVRNIKIISINSMKDSILVLDSLFKNCKVITNKKHEILYKLSHFYIDHITYVFLDTMCLIDSFYFISGSQHGYYSNNFVIKCSKSKNNYLFYFFQPIENKSYFRKVYEIIYYPDKNL